MESKLDRVLDSTIPDEPFEQGGTLEHWGVLGMRWGVRKDKRGSGKPRGSKKDSDTSSKKKPKKNDKGSGVREVVNRVTNKSVEFVDIKNPDGTTTRVTYNPNKMKVSQTNGKITLTGSRLEVDKFKKSLTDGNKSGSKQDNKSENKSGSQPSERVIQNQSSDYDQVLRERVNRLRLEKEYETLTAVPPKTKSEIQKFVEKQGGAVAGAIVSQVVVPAVVSALTNKTSPGSNVKPSDVRAAMDKANSEKPKNSPSVAEALFGSKDNLFGNDKNKPQKTESLLNADVSNLSNPMSTKDLDSYLDGLDLPGFDDKISNKKGWLD